VDIDKRNEFSSGAGLFPYPSHLNRPVLCIISICFMISLSLCSLRASPQYCVIASSSQWCLVTSWPVLIGPYTPPFELVKNEESIKGLGDLGVVLLMFALGLEFSLRKLTKVGLAAFVAALLEIALMMWLGYEMASMPSVGIR